MPISDVSLTTLFEIIQMTSKLGCAIMFIEIVILVLTWFNLSIHETLCKMRVCENMIMSSNKMPSKRF